MSPLSSSRRRVAVAAIAVVVALGACTHQRQVPDSYGATTQENFTEGCVDALTASDGEGEALSTAEAETACTCSYDAIVENIPFEEFKTINSDLEEEPGPLPAEVQELIAGCRAEDVPT